MFSPSSPFAAGSRFAGSLYLPDTMVYVRNAPMSTNFTHL
jgi:hypothetical protein